MLALWCLELFAIIPVCRKIEVLPQIYLIFIALESYFLLIFDSFFIPAERFEWFMSEATLCHLK